MCMTLLDLIVSDTTVNADSYLYYKNYVLFWMKMNVLPIEKSSYFRMTHLHFTHSEYVTHWIGRAHEISSIGTRPNPNKFLGLGTYKGTCLLTTAANNR